jgi:hypothetical protein
MIGDGGGLGGGSGGCRQLCRNPNPANKARILSARRFMVSI